MNYLGLDYGEKHIGLAIATTFVAEPLEVVPAVKIFDKIETIIKDYRIDVIVMGLSENVMAEKIKDFARQLAGCFNLPVHFQDETLSSQDTRRLLARYGVKKSIREAKTDHFVAAAILQEYLDSKG